MGAWLNPFAKQEVNDCCIFASKIAQNISSKSQAWEASWWFHWKTRDI